MPASPRRLFNRQSMNPILPRALVALAFAAAAPAAHACASCGCTLTTDWGSQGIATQPGLRMDLRFDYLDQSQLRHGTHAVDEDDLPLPQDFEVERGTINRYWTLGLDYSPNRDWGVHVTLPYTVRSHWTIPEGETDQAASHSASLGDARVLVRYQGFSARRDTGVQFGLKLPTGRHDVDFASGPEAGEPLDRGLQPGSGTTDLLLGVYRFAPMAQSWDYFVQADAQVPLHARDGFRPGESLTGVLGFRYVEHEAFVPELQVNLRTQRRDRGIEADVANSGGTRLELSPGMSFRVGKRADVFAFVQVPVWQRLNGYQLAPRYSVSVGARLEF